MTLPLFKKWFVGKGSRVVGLWFGELRNQVIALQAHQLH